jgi:DNA-binding MarR family transcriptional regulator
MAAPSGKHKTPCNCTTLRKATRRVSQLYDSALEPYGLRTTQRAVLSHIARSGRPPVGNLAEALVMDRGALTHNLKPLERDGLVEIRVAPDDRRNRLIALTRAGRAKFAESEPLWRRAQDGFERRPSEPPSRLRCARRLSISFRRNLSQPSTIAIEGTSTAAAAAHGMPRASISRTSSSVGSAKLPPEGSSP